MKQKFLKIGILVASLSLLNSASSEKEVKPTGSKVPQSTSVGEVAPAPLAKAYTNEYGVEWHPFGEEALSLSISGPNGLTYQETFGGETLPYFDFHDELGNLRPDGVYVYELKVIPNLDADTFNKMNAVRDSPDRREIIDEMKAAGELPADSPIQTGSFSFLNHEVLMGDAVNMKTLNTTDADEPKDQKDQVIPDDLIVQGSICSGFDCVNNESFGFDTIRLKENNLRIKFEDTSVGAFPTTDWQLTANDSASGGQSKFSIDDITNSRVPFTVEAAAPTNSLYVDSTGNLGMGTSTPVLDIQVTNGNTPALRLEQDGTSGFTAQTWDLAGNEANFFLRDVTNGSRLVFRAQPGAPSNSIYIASNGNIGLGNASPDNRLDVEGNAAIGAGYADSFAAPTNGLIVEGNVGIGTAQPAQSFHLEGNVNNVFAALIDNDNSGPVAYSTLKLGNDTEDLSGLIRMSSTNPNYSGGNGLELIQVRAHPIGFSTNNRNRMVVTGAGNVGIGLTTPTEKLEVAGNIRVTGGSFIDDGTSLSVPDYVFDEDYELISLDQVSEYIREHGHLPNVPSASQIQEDGLDLSAFQMKLLEKIEELTLYTLDQHEEIVALRKEIESLKTALK